MKATTVEIPMVSSPSGATLLIRGNAGNYALRSVTIPPTLLPMKPRLTNLRYSQEKEPITGASKTRPFLGIRVKLGTARNLITTVFLQVKTETLRVLATTTTAEIPMVMVSQRSGATLPTRE